MSPQNVVTWAEAAQKLLIPITMMIVATGASLVFSEFKSISGDISELKIAVAKIQTRLELMAPIKM